jgi:hypothetical protein
MSLKYYLTDSWQLNLVFYLSYEFSFITAIYPSPIGWSFSIWSKWYLFYITTGQVPHPHSNPHANYKGTLAFWRLRANLLLSGNLYLKISSSYLTLTSMSLAWITLGYCCAFVVQNNALKRFFCFIRVECYLF